MNEIFDYLKSRNAFQSSLIEEAFLEAPRDLFMPRRYIRQAAEDFPASIGCGQTISQPSTVAFMLELLQPKPGLRYLDVGSGSGWTTALLASCAGSQGSVLGVERHAELVETGRSNLSQLDIPQASIIEASFPLVPPGPYDRILISAAANEIPPELEDLLAPGGCAVFVVQSSVVRCFKELNEMSIERWPGFSFVPLVRENR